MMFEFKFGVTEKEIEQKNGPGTRNWISEVEEENNRAPRGGDLSLWELGMGEEHWTFVFFRTATGTFLHRKTPCWIFPEMLPAPQVYPTARLLWPWYDSRRWPQLLHLPCKTAPVTFLLPLSAIVIEDYFIILEEQNQTLSKFKHLHFEKHI